ncbi:MAG: peptidoglycan-binding protein, partial [Clostridia bacterium]|nr:peptidoglycan-binding protein [Clostridia bacterium]
MKKSISIILTVVMLLGSAALAEATPTISVQPIQATVTEKLASMFPVLDSLVRNMGIEGEVAYSAEDAEFVWTQLYLHGVNWGSLGEGVTVAEQITVSGEVMRGYAAAAFNGMTVLPEIPEDMSGISYDAASDTYVLGASDMGTTYTVIDRFAERADGSVVALVDLYDGNNMRLGSLTIDMAVAPEDCAWPYCVTNAMRDDMMDVSGLTFELCHITSWDLIPEATTPVAATPEATAQPTAKPTAAPYPTLKSGSKGEAVTKLQKRLAELGYPCGKADGDFGANTRRAVRYFQSAVGLTQDGVATDAVQKKLYAKSAPAYEQYVSLSKGDVGIRVEDLQARLRKLGYLAEPVDGIYGSRTKAAVALFQDEAGMKANGSASAKTIRTLMGKSAPECSAYIKLYRGDTGFRVTEMQEQLKRLGYLEKTTGRYDTATVAAVKAFAAERGIESNGRKADESLVKAMFEAPTPTVAPTAEPTAEPTPVPTEQPVETEKP